MIIFVIILLVIFIVLTYFSIGTLLNIQILDVALYICEKEPDERELESLSESVDVAIHRIYSPILKYKFLQFLRRKSDQLGVKK